MLDYMYYIGFILIFCVPFVTLLNLIFGFVQIPFAFISRGAVYFICFFELIFMHYTLQFAPPPLPLTVSRPFRFL